MTAGPIVAGPSAAGNASAAELLVGLDALLTRARHLKARGTWFRSLSTTHLHVIMMLESDGPLSMGELADALDVSLPSATGIVTRMEVRGLVERTREASDRRVVRVRLTEAGRAVPEELDLVRHEHLAALVGALTPAEQATCLAALTIVSTTLDRLGLEHDHRGGPRCPYLHATDREASRS